MIWVYLFYALLALAVVIGFNSARNDHREQKVKWENFKAHTGHTYFYRAPSEPTAKSAIACFAVFTSIAMLLALFASVVIGLIGSAIAWNYVAVPDVTYSNLATLNDGSGVSGRFFLGSGTIDSTAVFMYYTEDNGVYTLQHVDADYATVTYTDGPPEIVYHNKKTGNEFWVANWQEFSEPTHYEFRVPRGSVKSSFNLDAK